MYTYLNLYTICYSFTRHSSRLLYVCVCVCVCVCVFVHTHTPHTHTPTRIDISKFSL